MDSSGWRWPSHCAANRIFAPFPERPLNHQSIQCGEGTPSMLKVFDSIGRVALFGAQALRDAFVPPLEGEYLLTQFYEIGVGSFFLIIASGFALGVVMTLHTRSTLVQFGAEAEIPVFQSMAFFNEIGPLVAALLMAGRVGAGIGAQLANMRATEQIDAIETLSVDSFKLLVVTRIIA